MRWARRCSVSAPIRAVSSATWTSVEPVSASPRPCLATMSRLASDGERHRTRKGSSRPAARRMLTRPGGSSWRRSPAPGPRRAASAPRARPRSRSAARRACAPGRRCAALPVEVALEVDQVGLHQQAAAGLEGRPHPHVDGRGVAARPRRVDAVARAHEAVVGHEVRGGHAELAAAPVAPTTSPSKRNGPPRNSRGLGHLAGSHEAADVAGGDRLAGDLHERHHAGLERGLGCEQAPRRPPPRARSGSSRPPRPGPRPSRPRARRSTNDSALREANSSSKGITTSSSTPRPAIRSRLTATT